MIIDCLLDPTRTSPRFSVLAHSRRRSGRGCHARLHHDRGLFVAPGSLVFVARVPRHGPRWASDNSSSIRKEGTSATGLSQCSRLEIGRMASSFPSREDVC